MTLTLDRLEAAGWCAACPTRPTAGGWSSSSRRRAWRWPRQVNDALHRWERSLGIADDSRRITAVLDELADVLAAHPPDEH